MLIGASSPVNILRAADKNHGDEFWFDNEDVVPAPILLSFDWRSVVEAAGFVSPWWPASSQINGGFGFEGDALLRLSPKHTDTWRSFGSNGRLGFVGVTRDATGAPLGGCTVRAFVTSTNELVSQVVSDANGNYVATTPYLENHYLTVHKASAVPPVAGASIDTVQPA